MKRRSLLLATAAWPAAASRAQALPTIAAASDLQYALDALLAEHERATGQSLRVVYGASGTLAVQIRQGAPFQLFLSADESFVFQLADAGLTEDRGKRYAIGHIGLMVPHGSPLLPDGTLADLRRAITDGRLKKLAMANPAHAPYGMRAREALQRAGLWEAIQPHLVLGENIGQATQFATSGSTQGGIIAQSIAVAPLVAARGRFAPIDGSWHQPLAQRMVLMRGAPPALRDFYAHMGSPAAQVVLRRHGFEMP